MKEGPDRDRGLCYLSVQARQKVHLFWVGFRELALSLKGFADPALVDL